MTISSLAGIAFQTFDQAIKTNSSLLFSLGKHQPMKFNFSYQSLIVFSELPFQPDSSPKNHHVLELIPSKLPEKQLNTSHQKRDKDFQ